MDFLRIFRKAIGFLPPFLLLIPLFFIQTVEFSEIFAFLKELHHVWWILFLLTLSSAIFLITRYMSLGILLGIVASVAFIISAFVLPSSDPVLSRTPIVYIAVLYLTFYIAYVACYYVYNKEKSKK